VALQSTIELVGNCAAAGAFVGAAAAYLVGRRSEMERWATITGVHGGFFGLAWALAGALPSP
jgi:membrane protein DedA with SNARE-associated domain